MKGNGIHFFSKNYWALAIIGLLIFSFGFYAQRFDKVMNGWPVTDAVASSIRYEPPAGIGRPGTTYVTYQYTLNNTRFDLDAAYIGEPAFNRLSKGDKVSVQYDPKNNGRSRLSNPSGLVVPRIIPDRHLGLIIFAWGIGLMLLSVVGIIGRLGFWRKFRKFMNKEF